MPKFKKIYLERTMCYGDCPVYNLYINSEGEVKMISGDYFGRMDETQHWTIDTKQIKKLNEVLQKYGYFKIKKKEATYWQTDGPYCITKIEFEDGASREIEHYLGEDSWPKRLTTIENGIDRIVGVKDYYEANF